MTSKKSAWVMALTLNALIFLFLFAVVEIFFRVRYQDVPVDGDFHLYDPFRGHRLNPMYRARKDPYAYHSPDGFRSDKAFSVEKPERTFRILMLGGSALYGLGAGGGYPEHRILRNDETISYFLEKKLNEDLQAAKSSWRVEVMNAGVSAYHTFQHLVYLNEDLLMYVPDLVINFDGHNDFYGSNPKYSHWRDYDYSSAMLVEMVNSRHAFLPFFFFIRWGAKYLYSFRAFERFNQYQIMDRHLAEQMNLSKDSILPGPVTRQNVESYARNTYLRALLQIQALGKIENYQHLLVIQPEIVQENAKYLGAKDRELQVLTAKLKADRYQKSLEIAQYIPDILTDAKIEFLDFRHIAALDTTKEQLYLDYCHLSPHGTRLVGERLGKILLSRIIR
jgi:hypothetical protein